MKPILINNDRVTQLNALFIQPTRWCGLNCKGCYVKEHTGGEEDYHVSNAQMIKLFNKFYQSDEAWANQITIAVDDMHKDASKAYHMMSFIHAVLNRIELDERPKEERPEVHFTCHTDRTWEKYTAQSPRYLPATAMASHLNMLSLSEITRPRYVKNLAKYTHINYNHLVPRNVSSKNIDKYVQKMTDIGEIVDSIYIVMLKSPVGGARSPQQDLLDANNMKQDIAYMGTMLKRLPEHVRRKVNIDGCLQDTLKSKRTGFGCSSNVSRVQVWPDGSVSGCPYAFRGTTVGARTAGGILENIKQVRKRYEFRELCHLPAVHDIVTRRSKDSKTKVQNGRPVLPILAG